MLVADATDPGFRTTQERYSPVAPEQEVTIIREPDFGFIVFPVFGVIDPSTLPRVIAHPAKALQKCQTE